jgi:hypothetical protein
MNAWRLKLVNEILLTFFFFVTAVYLAVHASSGVETSVGATFAERVALPVILASWVASDARTSRRGLCYDFDTFIFFAWPIALPYYLFHTRGVRAFLTLLGFAGICLAAVTFGFAVYGILLLLKR